MRRFPARKESEMAQGVGADRDDSLDRIGVLHGLNGIVASGGAPVKLSVQEDKRQWYYVCSRCGAKSLLGWGLVLDSCIGRWAANLFCATLEPDLLRGLRRTR